MRGRSEAAVAAWLFAAAACGREEQAEGSAQRAAAAPATPGEGEGEGGERARSGDHAITPWGIYRERQEDTVRAAEDARRAVQEEEARRVKAQVEREMAELEAKADAMEREARAARRATTPGGSASTSTPDPAPLSRSEPAPAPMSRPDPEPKLLVAPPLGYTLRTEAPLSHQGPQPKLEQRSVKRNAITDMDAWFLAHGLSLPTWEVPSTSPFFGRSPGSSGDPLPAEVPATFLGNALGTAIRGADRSIAIYSAPGGVRGRSVVVRDAFGDALGAFDLSAWPPDQELHWAQAEEGVLYLCTYHMTYASSTAGNNAFLTAIALGTGELLWQSEPLVCNTWNFLLRDGWIISGYGFTAEPDFLFVLDAKTGEVATKKKLASGPEVILEKAGTLFVRTYDRDYEFVMR